MRLWRGPRRTDVSVLGDFTWPLAVIAAVYRLATAWERFSPPLPQELPAPEDVAVPEDLVALAMTHSEPWAQEDTLKAMRERYAELKDWQKVRFAFGVGRVDG